NLIMLGAIMIAFVVVNGQSSPQENSGDMDSGPASAAADNSASIGAATAVPCSGINFSQPAGSPVAAISPLFMVTADLNGDGKLDLAATSNTSNTVQVFIGNGNGGFTPRTPTSFGPG